MKPDNSITMALKTTDKNLNKLIKEGTFKAAYKDCLEEWFEKHIGRFSLEYHDNHDTPHSEIMEFLCIDRYAKLLHKLLCTENDEKLPTGATERKMLASLKEQYKKFIEHSDKEVEGFRSCIPWQVSCIWRG
jgi:hypothetical protein